ncbi:MAG: GntR family transcriptional regulator [Candidatus Accumulibacter sp.]|jgi:GntR family transcriptional regulator|nr:GntR family transcriptional regulator [Accumulibacter sp.]
MAYSPAFNPLYRQIRGLILRSLESGEWRPGDIIPSESELALRFGVSQGTIRKAIDEMAVENLLVRRQGKGTFVASHNDPNAFFHFLRLAANEGKLPPHENVPIECERAAAGQNVAKILALEVGAPVYIVRRVMRFGNAPVVFDEIYLSSVIFPDLTLDILKTEHRSLYTLFESRYGVCMIRANERLYAVSADSLSAKHLEVNEGVPLLLVERVSYTYGDRPVEWRRGFYSTRDYHYYNELG